MRLAFSELVMKFPSCKKKRNLSAKKSMSRIYEKAHTHVNSQHRVHPHVFPSGGRAATALRLARRFRRRWRRRGCAASRARLGSVLRSLLTARGKYSHVLLVLFVCSRNVGVQGRGGGLRKIIISVFLKHFFRPVSGGGARKEASTRNAISPTPSHAMYINAHGTAPNASCNSDRVPRTHRGQKITPVHVKNPPYGVIASVEGRFGRRRLPRVRF